MSLAYSCAVYPANIGAIGLAAVALAALLLSEMADVSGPSGEAMVFAQREDRLAKRERDFDSLLRLVADALRRQTDENARFGQSLHHANLQLERVDHQPQIQAVIIGLIEANGKLESKLKEVNASLEDSRAKLERLRCDLTAAEELASRDPLTGLGNRRFFEKALAETMERARDSGKELCLALCDIDDFKGVNDRYGHLVGDNVIRLVGQMMQRNVKDHDVLARLGGDEFVLIFPNTRIAEASRRLNNIRHEVANKQWKSIATGDRLSAVSVTFGVVNMRAGETPEEMISRADACLYEAKRRGKNGVKAEALDIADASRSASREILAPAKPIAEG